MVSFSLNVVGVTFCTASLKVALTSVSGETPVAPAAGDFVTTVGGVVSLPVSAPVVILTSSMSPTYWSPPPGFCPTPSGSLLLIEPRLAAFVCVAPSTVSLIEVDVFAQVMVCQAPSARFLVPRMLATFFAVSLNRQNAGLVRLLPGKISIFHSPPVVLDTPLRMRS